MATAPTPEKSARDVLRIFAAKAVRAGENLMRGDLSLACQRAGGINAELMDGLKYSIKQGWLEKNGTAFRLTEAGFSAMPPTGYPLHSSARRC
jgi:hypothetical protein